MVAVNKCYPYKMCLIDKQLSIVNDFKADLHHDQNDDHPFQSDMMFVTEMVRQELYQFQTMVYLQVHCLE